MNKLHDAANPAPGVRVDPIPSPKLTRTRKPKLEHHVLRMHDIHRPQPAAGLRLPSTLVSTRSRRAGPTSSRPSRNKHKRSASANIGHQARPREAIHKQDQQCRRKSLETLRRLHLGLMRDIHSGRSAEARYETTRKRHLDRWSHDRHVIETMEAGHEQSERPAA